MSARGAKQQVLAILEANGLRWTDDRGEHAVRFASALLRVGFAQLGAQTVITLRAPVLTQIPLATSDETDRILRELNRLNEDTHFGKWVFYGGERVIALEYDLLGDHLQEDELMTAFAMLARFADREDDLLQRKFGGQRSFE